MKFKVILLLIFVLFTNYVFAASSCVNNDPVIDKSQPAQDVYEQIMKCVTGTQGKTYIKKNAHKIIDWLPIAEYASGNDLRTGLKLASKLSSVDSYTPFWKYKEASYEASLGKSKNALKHFREAIRKQKIYCAQFDKGSIAAGLCREMVPVTEEKFKKSIIKGASLPPDHTCKTFDKKHLEAGSNYEELINSCLANHSMHPFYRSRYAAERGKYLFFKESFESAAADFVTAVNFVPDDYKSREEHLSDLATRNNQVHSTFEIAKSSLPKYKPKSAIKAAEMEFSLLGDTLLSLRYCPPSGCTIENARYFIPLKQWINTLAFNGHTQEALQILKNVKTNIRNGHIKYHLEGFSWSKLEAQVYVYSKDIDRAISIYKSYINDPQLSTRSKAYINMSAIYLDQNELDAALANANSAIEIAPSAETYYQRFRVHAEQENWKACESDIEQAIVYKNENFKMWETLAIVKMQQKDYAGAIAVFERANANVKNCRACVQAIEQIKTQMQ